MSTMRSVSEVIAALIIIAVTISALSIALTVITNFMKTHQPRGESIDVSVVVQKSLPSIGTLSTIKATIYISCTGPNCDKYTVNQLSLTGYNRTSGKSWQLAVDTNTYRIQHGITKLSILGYYDANTQTINEVVVYLKISGPSYQKDIYKSVSIG